MICYCSTVSLTSASVCVSFLSFLLMSDSVTIITAAVVVVAAAICVVTLVKA